MRYSFVSFFHFMGDRSMSVHTELLHPFYCIFQTIRCTFPPQIWEENGGTSYSPNVAYLARTGGKGGRQRGSGVTEDRSRTTCFASNFFFLSSSSKTQVHLMVQCVLQSKKYGKYILLHCMDIRFNLTTAPTEPQCKLVQGTPLARPCDM